MTETIIGTICALALGWLAYNIEKSGKVTPLQMISASILSIFIVTYSVASTETECLKNPAILTTCQICGMFIPSFISYAIFKAKHKELHIVKTVLTILFYICTCITIYTLGYCKFSCVLYVYATFVILGVAISVKIIQTFGSLIYQMFKKN